MMVFIELVLWSSPILPQHLPGTLSFRLSIALSSAPLYRHTPVALGVCNLPRVSRARLTLRLPAMRLHCGEPGPSRWLPRHTRSPRSRTNPRWQVASFDWDLSVLLLSILIPDPYGVVNKHNSKQGMGSATEGP